MYMCVRECNRQKKQAKYQLLDHVQQQLYNSGQFVPFSLNYLVFLLSHPGPADCAA